MILCSSPLAQYLDQREDIDAAIRRVLEGGRYILGPEAAAFEREFAAYVGVTHAIGVGSGTDALYLSLKACGVGPGDEVITVSHTAVATVAAIELAGATPVLVDIEPHSYAMDPSRLAQRITKRTKAIVPVHIYGHPVDIATIVDVGRRAGVPIIEDCAQAHGARFQGRRVGSFGDLSCFSFYPTKNLGAIGDGGLVATSNPELAERVRLLREYGWLDRYISVVQGSNSRLDELQAAVLRVKLSQLDADNARRRALAQRYTDALANTHLVLPSVRTDVEHVFHLYVVRTPKRAALQQFLADRGISSLIHYPTPIHLQPAYLGRVVGAEALEATERIADEVLSLPLYPQLSAADADAVIDAVRDFDGDA